MDTAQILFGHLLSEETRSNESKKQLALKFEAFNQLAVDLAVESGDLVEAWEYMRTRQKCLFKLNFFRAGIIIFIRPTMVQFNNYLIPQQQSFTGILVQWPLHTFILKDQAPSPILLFTPMQDAGAIPLGEDALALNELPLPEQCNT